MKAAFKKEEFGIRYISGEGEGGGAVCMLGKGTPLWYLQCGDSAGREVSYNLSTQHVASWASTGSVGTQNLQPASERRNHTLHCNQIGQFTCTQSLRSIVLEQSSQDLMLGWP